MRLYRLLLRLYPSSFRNEYGRELQLAVEQRRRELGGAGPAFWMEVLADTAVNAARLHWEMLRQDLRYTARALGRAPGFTLTVLAVSAIGIGATTSAFSIADHVLVRPLPFHEPGRLVKLWQDQGWRGYPQMEVSPANYRDWVATSRSFESMGAYFSVSRNLIGRTQPERLDGIAVTPGLLTTLGTRAALGRTFVPSGGEPAAPSTMLLSDGLWRRLFDADPAIVGRDVVLDDRPHTVVGVMPPGFAFPTREAMFWTALRFEPPQFLNRSDALLNVVARLKDGTTIDEARAEMQVIAAQLARDFPEANARSGVTILALSDQVSWRTRGLLVALVAAATCVLLIACTNLANLLLARSLARRHELAVRMAIGAAPERLIRQMLTESLVLASLGGAGALFLASIANPMLVRLVPTTLPIAEVPPLDVRMLALAAAGTVATALGFGLFPALRVRRAADMAGLREGSRGGTAAIAARLRGTLVVTEIAIAVVLLVLSGLLARALWRIQEVDPGVRPEGVLTMRTWLPMPKYAATARRQRFYDDVLERVRALPGVSGAGYISFLPMTMRGGIWPVAVEGTATGLPHEPVASLRFVTPGALEALGVALRRGRAVNASDTRSSTFVAVVSESFARRHWPGADPLGRRFEMAFFTRTVVGVVADVSVRGLERISEPQVYLPSTQVPDGGVPFYAPKDLAIRASGDLPSLIPAIREAIARADPQQPISDIQLLEDVIRADTAPRRVQIAAIGTFAAVAFVLACLGIHGLLAFVINAQQRELGVRIALGAGPGRILALVLRRTAVWAACGIGAGAVLSVLAGRTMQSMLAGVPPADPLTFAGAVALVLAMSAAGSLVPACRAVRVDPLIALRQPD